MATQRSERIRCHLPCELHLRRRRKAAATVTGLSDKGLSVATAQRVDQGDALRLCILPHRGARAVWVDAIVWSAHNRVDRRSGESQSEVGFLLSDSSPAFLALLDEVRRREAPPALLVVGKAPPCDDALPRPRNPLPPPKLEEDETLPRFRVRLKHGGSPRSRSATLRAHSAQEAERRALGDLESEWEVLEVVRLRG